MEQDKKPLADDEMEKVTGGEISAWRKFELEDSVFIAVCTPGMTLEDEIRAHARNKEEKQFIIEVWNSITHPFS